MAASDSMHDANRSVARQILDDARKNPRSVYAGKFVGIANGRVAVIADNWDELAERLRESEPNFSKTLSLEVDADYDAIQEIWRLA